MIGCNSVLSVFISSLRGLLGFELRNVCVFLPMDIFVNTLLLWGHLNFADWRLYVCVQLFYPYRGVFPVAYNLFEVMTWVKQEVFPPFIPVHHHGAIDVHTAETQRNKNDDIMQHTTLVTTFRIYSHYIQGLHSRLKETIVTFLYSFILFCKVGKTLRKLSSTMDPCM